MLCMLSQQDDMFIKVCQVQIAWDRLLSVRGVTMAWGQPKASSSEQGESGDITGCRAWWLTC